MGMIKALGQASTWTKIYTGVQRALNWVLRANPIGIVITVLAALAAGLRIAYVHSDGFRAAVDRVWAALKKAGAAVVDVAKKVWAWLVKAFEKVSGVLAKVWQYIKWVFGIKTEDKLPAATAAATAGMEQLGEATEETSAAVDGLSAKLGKVKAAPAAPADTMTAGQRKGADLGVSAWELNTLEQYEARIRAIRDAQQTADIRHYAELQKQAELVERMAETFKAGVPKTVPAPVGEQVNRALGAAGFNTARPEDLKLGDSTKVVTELNTEMGESVNLMDAFSKGWGGIKSGVGAVQSMTDALRGNGSAWKKVTAIVDGALSLYTSIPPIMQLINTLTGESTAMKSTETGATLGLATASTTAATANTQEAATGVMAAHAKIPFVGIAIAAGMIATMVALLASLPKFADGGLAFGPSLGVFGEYAGARSNPEVVAPLSKLKQYIADAVPAETRGIAGDVHFRISGRDLEGVLVKRSKYLSRT